MIDKIKNVGIVLTVAILFTVLMLSITNAAYPNPKYEDFCREMPVPVKFAQEPDKCGETRAPIACNGPVEYIYDEKGCPKEAKCDSCSKDLEDARKKYNLVLFIISSISGVLAILFGLSYRKNDEFSVLIRSGFVVGGLASIFFGTVHYYGDMGRFVRPAVILAELAIVIVVTYKIIKKNNLKLR